MRDRRALFDEHGIVLIADEVQTSFARTGNWIAMVAYVVSADITTMTKDLAGGLPLAAITGRSGLMDAAHPNGLGGTYGGNPLGVAAAHMVMEDSRKRTCSPVRMNSARAQFNVSNRSAHGHMNSSTFAAPPDGCSRVQHR